MALKLMDGFGDFGIKFVNLFNTLTATVNNLAAGTPPGTYTPGTGIDISGSNVISAANAGITFNFAGAIAPAGALVYNGQELNKVTYAILYAAIGDLWATTGGVSAPSAANFRLPPQELNGLGLYARGKSSGATVGDHNANQNKSHNHSANHDHTASSNTTGNHTHTVGGRTVKENAPDDAGGFNYATVVGTGTTTSANGNHSHAVTVNTKTMNTGSDGGSEARPESVVFLGCIWTGL